MEVQVEVEELTEERETKKKLNSVTDVPRNGAGARIDGDTRHSLMKFSRKLVDDLVSFFLMAFGFLSSILFFI